jgi:Tfp pilus assembly protein PilF
MRRLPQFALCLLLAACGREEAPPEPAGPPPGEAALTSGRQALELGRYAEADAWFQQAYTQGADPHTTLMWRIRARVAMGRLEAATEDAKRLTELQAGEPAHRVLLVRLHMLQGDLQEAWVSLAELKRRAPDLPETALLDAELHLALGYASRAQHLVAEGARRFPDRAEWPFHAAKVDLLKHYASAARGAYDAAAKASGRADGFLREGWFSYLLGEPDRAEKAYIDAAVRGGADPTPYSLSSDFYAAIGRYADGLNDLGALRSRLGHDTPDLTRRIATLLVRADRQPDAQKLLTPYLKERNDDRAAARELALSYLREGKLREALTTLEVLAGRAPDDPDTQYLLGVARLRMRADVEARTAFDDARRLAPERYPAHLAVAVTALRNQDFFDAEYEARQVLERQPGHLVAGLVFASARKQTRQPAVAWLIRERLVARHPDRAETIRKLVSLPEDLRPTEADERTLPADVLDRLVGPMPL